MSHAARNQREIETNRIEDEETSELPATKAIGSTTAIVRSINFLKRPMAIWFAFGALLGGGTAVPLIGHKGDDIAAMKAQVDAMQAQFNGMQSDVTTIKNILLQKALGP